MPEDDSLTVYHGLDGNTLAALNVATPIVAVDLPRLKSLAFAAAAAHVRQGLAWKPRADVALYPSITAALLSAGADGICCSTLSAARAAAAAGFASITLTLPPMAGAGPEHAAALSGVSKLTVLVDHFAQAERLSLACERSGTRLDLLVRVDVGKARLGVRPGPDLHDLALGVARLPSVDLAGIAVEASSLGSSGVSRLTPAELHRLLDRCRRCLERAGVAPDVVSIKRAGDDVQAGPIATEARTPFPDPSRHAIAIAAGVVGRPTRHGAIVDAGRSRLTSAATVIWPRDVRVETVTLDDEFGVLRLEDGGRSLTIGDVVVLAAEGGVDASHADVALMGDGERWWIERPVTSEIVP